MKTKILLFAFLLFASNVGGQNVPAMLEKAVALYQEGKIDNAIKQIDKCIAIMPNEPILWYNRGIFHAGQLAFEASLIDFSKAIALDPLNKKFYNSRGNSRQDVTDYRGAVCDYKEALSLDTAYVDAWWNLAETWEKLSDSNAAAYCYKKCCDLGDDPALERLNYYRQNKLINDTMLNLTAISTDTGYGNSAQNPVYVGYNIYTTPQSERYYLDQLYDAQGNQVKYERLGSCCQYKSERGLLGYALLDKYMLTYRDEHNNEIKRILYISSYDHKDTMVPYGLFLKKE